MTWVINFDEEKALVAVKASGAVKEAPLREMTRELRDAVFRHGSKRLLIDYTDAVSFMEPYEVFERPKILRDLGFPADVKVAVLYRALDEHTQFLENVYRNKSFSVRVFAERDQALSWLENHAD